jgi:hypothetical protein
MPLAVDAVADPVDVAALVDVAERAALGHRRE